MKSLIKEILSVIKSMHVNTDFIFINKVMLVLGMFGFTIMVMIAKTSHMASQVVIEENLVWYKLIVDLFINSLFCALSFFSLIILIANCTHYPKPGKMFILKLIFNIPLVIIYSTLFLDDLGDLLGIIYKPFENLGFLLDYLEIIFHGLPFPVSLIIAAFFNLIYLSGYGYKPPARG